MLLRTFAFLAVSSTLYPHAHDRGRLSGEICFSFTANPQLSPFNPIRLCWLPILQKENLFRLYHFPLGAPRAPRALCTGSKSGVYQKKRAAQFLARSLSHSSDIFQIETRSPRSWKARVSRDWKAICYGRVFPYQTQRFSVAAEEEACANCCGVKDATYVQQKIREIADNQVWRSGRSVRQAENYF